MFRNAVGSVKFKDIVMLNVESHPELRNVQKKNKVQLMHLLELTKITETRRTKTLPTVLCRWITVTRARGKGKIATPTNVQQQGVLEENRMSNIHQMRQLLQ